MHAKLFPQRCPYFHEISETRTFKITLQWAGRKEWNFRIKVKIRVRPLFALARAIQFPPTSDNHENKSIYWGPQEAGGHNIRYCKLLFMLTSAAGGPSTVIDTKCSPLNNTSPSTRFSSFSTPLLLFDFIFLNSSQSPSIKFMCLSKAKNEPINTRPSCRVHLMR